MKNYIFLIVLLFPLNYSVAQEMKVIRDLRFKGEIGVEKTFFKNWKIGVETTLKLEKNASRIDEIDFDISTDYSPINFLSFGLGYRLAYNQKSDSTYEKKYRYYAQAEFDQNIKRFKLEYRFRYQNIDDDFFQYEKDYPSKSILRNRLQLAYNIPKLPVEPFTYAELYGLLKKNEDFASKIKLALGIRYNLKKYGKVKAYYRIDIELNSLYPYTFYTIGLNYTFDF